MIATSTAIRADCDIAHPRKRVFAHWTSPKTRVRWETGPDTGMHQTKFDMREGGVEETDILKDGQVVGKMTQRIHALIEGELLATSTTYSVEGEVTMMAQIALEASDFEGGCKISVVAQIIDLTGQQVTEQHKSGWAWIFSRFEADIAEYGLIELEDTGR